MNNNNEKSRKDNVIVQSKEMLPNKKAVPFSDVLKQSKEKPLDPHVCTRKVIITYR